MPFIKIKSNSIFSVHKVYGVKLLSRLRLKFSHLNEYKVRDGFKDGTNCMCNCGIQQYRTIRLELLHSIYNLDPKIRNLSNEKLLHLKFYGSKLYSFETKREISKLTIKLLKLTKYFKRPFLWPVVPLPFYHLYRNLITFFSNL